MKVMRNRKQNELKLMRRELGKLLATGQDPSARIRVEHIIREQNILAAYDLLELFCELIVVRLPIIDMQKECPPDLRESIASLIFAAPRCADLPELLQAKQLFQSKYGREFVAAADELRPGCGVNRTIIEKLSVRAPSGESKLALLKEIAAEQNVDWDASASERELVENYPDDLLDPRPSSRRPGWTRPPWTRGGAAAMTASRGGVQWRAAAATRSTTPRAAAAAARRGGAITRGGSRTPLPARRQKWGSTPGGCRPTTSR